jgi:hypothetical protein
VKVALVDVARTGNPVKMCPGHYRDFLGHLGGQTDPGQVMFGEGECRGCKMNGPHPQRDLGWPQDQYAQTSKKGVRKQAHDSGDGATIFHCLAGETRFLTPEGPRTLAECAGQEVLVLTGALDSSRGGWAPAHIHSFGQQRLWAVTLKRNKQTKVLHATDGHRWLVRRPDRIVTTQDLIPGHRLAHVRMERYSGSLDHEGVRHGFHFGDGSVQVRGERTYGIVTLWGPKRDLADYFREVARAEYEAITESGVEGLRFTSGMKDYRKELPSLHAPAEYLYGWLAGYVAADGTVGKNGQVTLSSAVQENLEHVRDIATLLGIGAYGITGKMRKGFDGQPSMLFQMGLSAADLPGEFFLRDDHRERCNPQAQERFGWTVVSVVETDRVEEVYCAVVPGTESFALEDNIHTGNCPFCGSGQVIARSDRTTECEYCHTCFTVQVQPQFPAFPQTVDGMPMQVPGMPGQIGGPPAAPGQDLMDPMGGDPMGGGDPGAAEDGGFPPGDDEGGEDDSEDSGDDAPPWAKNSVLKTASGAELNFQNYLRHLAIRHAGKHKDAVIERVRKERS